MSSSSLDPAAFIATTTALRNALIRKRLGPTFMKPATFFLSP